MASLGRRLESLEARISPDRPKLIFIVPYIYPAEKIRGISATVDDTEYCLQGNCLDALVIELSRLILLAKNSLCRVVTVNVV